MTVTQEQFSSVKEDMRTLSAMISQIQETVTDHTYRLSLIRTRLDNWDIRFEKVDRRLDKVEGRLDGLQVALSELQGSVAGLQGSVNEILTLIRKGS